MYKNLFSVGALTLLSRATGFARDIMLAAALGTGVLANAFYIAFRLPNHFRAIFGEGAFNAAYVPSYARVLETEGAAPARSFANRIFTLLLASQLVLLLLAWGFTPQALAVLAPGVDADPQKLAYATAMTRITFPYLLCITLVLLQAGTLNANGRFIAAAFAPVLLNLVMIACLAAAFIFPNAGIAASWGVALAGLAQLTLLLGAAWRARVMARPAWPRLDSDVKRFFKSFGPAVIGSAGVQIALFADTIIASLIPDGVALIYYADRIYQLPIGVIGVAAGAVLLPEMSRRHAAGDPGAAMHAQSRAMALTIALSAPFFIVFLIVPDLIMRGVFMRGRFTEQAAVASAHVLAAYAIGLLAVVLIASARASFQAKGDTTTPMIAALVSVALNVALKIALFHPYGAPGLAFATAVGAWINFGLLAAIALRSGAMRLDATFWKICAAVACASALAALVAWLFPGAAERIAAVLPGFRNACGLLLVLAGVFLAYGLALVPLLALLGVRLSLRGGRAPASASPHR
ncbi:MAG TPA: murein biosynthesis integral membrane protein MurJ [Beijerinckiaceae bacterium]|nr:murein biosynthesis integral membrane protein MurJ [Beijerinckiaceae bacterium]